MKYRCYYETFVDVEADSKLEANKKAAEKIIDELKSSPTDVTSWEDND